MFKKRIKEAPAEPVSAEPVSEEKASVEKAASPAERIGQALLASIGVTDEDEIAELADAMLKEWGSKKAEREAVRADEASRRAPERHEAPSPEEVADLFETRPKRPVPMKAGSSAAAPLDYAGMSPKQFSELKKKLKKAAMNGERIKI